MEPKQTEYLAAWFDGKVAQMGLSKKSTKEEVRSLANKCGAVGVVTVVEVDDVIQHCDTCRQCWRRMATMCSQN